MERQSGQTDLHILVASLSLACRCLLFGLFLLLSYFCGSRGHGLLSCTGFPVPLEVLNIMLLGRRLLSNPCLHLSTCFEQLQHCPSGGGERMEASCIRIYPWAFISLTVFVWPQKNPRNSFYITMWDRVDSAKESLGSWWHLNGRNKP